MFLNQLSLFIAILCIGISISKEIEIENNWIKFKADFNKAYDSIEEEQLRKSIWLKNLNYVASFETLNPKASFQVKLNALADRNIEVTLSF